MKQKHITWWDSLPDNERAIIKDYYGIGLLATDSQIEYIWVKEGRPEMYFDTEHQEYRQREESFKSRQQIASEWWEGLEPEKRRQFLKNYYPRNVSISDSGILHIYSTETGRGATNTQQRKEGEGDIVERARKIIPEYNELKVQNEELKAENKRLLTTIDGLLETGSSRLTIRQFTDLKREMEHLQDINRELLEWLEKANNNGRELLENYANGHRDGNEWKSFAGAVCEVYETYKNKK